MEEIKQTENKRYFNFRPFVFCAISVVLGVVCSLFAIFYGFLIILLPLLLMTCIGIIFAFNKSKSFSYCAFLMALLFILASFICYYKIYNIRKYERSIYFDPKVVEGKVGAVETYDDIYLYVLKKPTFDGEKLDCNVRFYSVKKLEKGDVVRFNATVKPIEKDDYFRFLSNNIGFTASVTDEVIIFSQSRSVFDNCYLKIKSTITENLGDESPFALALITGDSSLINNDELLNFRFSGISHVFAVSGLHIGFLVGVLGAVFEFLKIKREKKAFLITLFALFYSGVCGFTPSSIRATIMCAVHLFAQARGKKYDSLNSIALSLIIVLMINPFDVLSAGFVLSYACVISIALFYKTFENYVRFAPEKLNQSIALCLSVQFGVAPIVCYYFGYTSIVSVLLNLLVVPIISALYPILLVVVILSLIIKPLAFMLKVPGFVIYILRNLASLIEFDRLNLFINLSPVMIAIYYFIAIFASDRLNVPKNVKLISVVSSSILMLMFAI